MRPSVRLLGFLGVMTFVAVGCMTTPAISADNPAEGYDIHVQAPHLMADGQVGGPFHHYCKPISAEVLQCLLFESTDPKAKLVAIEYFIAKELARKEVPLIKWHRFFHDHKVEIATGRVQVLNRRYYFPPVASRSSHPGWPRQLSPIARPHLHEA
jgi:hypothetical protein